uniref:NACHT and WD repeat domain-containing protein 2-like n=1 Tax=Crassostrea virginica TaxID=6565 RepID=A0A8B8BBU3_CRAVI|nr:NACHT and WD repeat domain-containing protein 2-like [Crassostrea virginica]
MYRKYLLEIALRERETQQQLSSSLATNVQTVNNGAQVPTSEGVKKPPDPTGKPRDQPNSTSQTQETQENEQTLDPFVVGNFDSRFPNTTKMIRLYISSTSTDTENERNSWMAKAYPKIKEHCFSKGYEFQVLDMRWGVCNQATDDHMTPELCLHELEKCQTLSKGPTFVSLIAQRYGHRLLHRMVNEKEFRKIQSAVTEQSDLAHISRWYLLDENAIPPVYSLKPVSTNIPDFLSEDSKTQKAAKSQWWEECERLMEIIARGAASALDENAAKKYMISVTEQETELALNTKNADKRSFWFRREFKNLENHAPSHLLSNYIECLGNEEVWQAARAKNKELKKRLENRLSPEHIYTYHVDWTDKGLDANNKAHAEYLDKITTDFQQQMISSIDKSIEEREKNERLALTPDSEEFMKHAVLVQEKCEGIRGRDAIIQKIKEYVLGDNWDPLVIHGESGCGKTSIMAQAAKEAFHWIQGKGMVVMRFLGTTHRSTNVLTLLQSMVSQMQCFMNMPDTIPKDIRSAVLVLHACIRRFCLSQTPVVILLDAVDQLDPAHNAHQVASWIPRDLENYVSYLAFKIIISTNDHPEYGILEGMKKFIPEKNFIPVPLLTSEERVDVLNHWIETHNKKLTGEQKSYILHMFEKCPLPLYFKLSFREALEWTSFRPIEECRLQDTIRGTIDHMFAKLESKHGKLFISRALGYITIAKHGLSEFELEDILSCDDDVLNDVYQHWIPPTRRIPPILIVRLRYDLGQFLVSHGDSGIQIMSWYHRQFWEAAEDRYTSDPAVNHVLHTGIADYFLGRWAGETPKPYTDKNGEASAIRFVVRQPIEQGSQMNERKLINLPYHLSKSGNLQDLKHACLLNFDFLISKMSCLPTALVQDDFTLALSVFPGEEDLIYLSQAINLSGPALSHDPRQLPAQILDRLENTEFQSLQGFLDQCRNSVYPYVQCSHSLQKCMVNDLRGHTSVVNSLDLHQQPGGILLALTEELIFFNALTGSEIKRKEMPAEYRPFGREFLIGSENYIVLSDSSKTRISVYNMQDETFSQFADIRETGSSSVERLAITEDETCIITTRSCQELAIYDIASLKRMWSTQQCEGKIDFSVATYSTKGFIVICTEDKIVMWDERLKSMVRSIPHPKTLQDAKTVDMKVFVSIAWDNHIRVWGISREDMSNKPTLQDSTIFEEVLVDDDIVLGITDNDKIKAISLNSASVVNEFEGFASYSNNICLLNGGKDKCILLFDENLYKSSVQQGKSFRDFEMTDMRIIRDELLAVGYGDGALRIWNLAKGQIHRTLHGHLQGISVMGNPDGPLMMSYSGDREENLTRVWDVHTWDCVASYQPDVVFSDVTPGRDGESFVVVADNQAKRLTLNTYSALELECEEVITETKGFVMIDTVYRNTRALPRSPENQGRRAIDFLWNLAAEDCMVFNPPDK